MSARTIDGDALAEYVEHFRYRTLQDAFSTATRDYWLARAETFEAARPGGYIYPADYCRHGRRPHGRGPDECPVVHRKGDRKVDWPGAARAEQIAEQDARLAAIARACRERAAVSLLGGDLA